MKIWISCDMEGVAGIVDWDQCLPGSSGYALGCALLQDEVNAAIEGAVAGGATEIVVNDSHGRMANLDPRKIAGGAGYLSGRHKPMYMVEGLDGSFDAVFLVGYHGSISGVVKNALDSLEGLRDDPRPYFDGRAVGCIVSAGGAQASGSTLAALRSIIHAMRGWPTPFGATLNTGVGLFGEDGAFLDPKDAWQVETVAAQVMAFARAWIP